MQHTLSIRLLQNFKLYVVSTSTLGIFGTVLLRIKTQKCYQLLEAQPCYLLEGERIWITNRRKLSMRFMYCPVVTPTPQVLRLFIGI